ncbi:MAG: hypothetical protein GC162_11545 [Planctomycetes bacterium]|nr:hypothetical protein [Planctomycetota bacterium]
MRRTGAMSISGRVTAMMLTGWIVLSAWAGPVRAEDEVRKITIHTLAAQMKYDTESFSVNPGQKVELTLVNDDEMPHNIALLLPDAADANGVKFAMEKIWTLGDKGLDLNWLPPNEARILAALPLIDPHTQKTLTFTAPKETGKYPFICTLPGHAMMMNGTMEVGGGSGGLGSLHYDYYKGDFKTLPDFSKLTPTGSGQINDGLIDFGVAPVPHEYALRFTGTFATPAAGAYDFYLACDDGARVIVDGKTIVEEDGIHPSTKLSSGRVKLAKGDHTVVVEYFENQGERGLYVAYAQPKGPRTALSKWLHPSHGGSNTATKNEFVGIPIEPAHGEAVMYREFIAGLSPRGIGVGYPGGVNIGFDADECNMRMVWQGAFMDAKRHWTGRGVGFQPPSGYGVVNVNSGAPLAVLEKDEANWPASKDATHEPTPGYRFKGYVLDAHRYPTFKYVFGGVSVEDTAQPGGDAAKGTASLTRIMKLTSDASVDRLFVRVADCDKIEPTPDGAYMLDGQMRLRVEGVTPTLRHVGRGDELIAPVSVGGKAVELRFTYDWPAFHAHVHGKH